MDRFSFIAAVSDETAFARCEAHLRRLGVRDIVAIRKAASLAEAYDQGVSRARNDILVLLHQDVDLEGMDERLVLERLTSDRRAILGAAGSRVLGRSGVWWQWRTWRGAALLSGRMGHRSRAGDTRTEYGPFGNVAVLDGALLITNKATVAAVGGFRDPAIGGFDFYDLSFTLRAALLGLTVSTIPVDAYHWSIGWPRRHDWETHRRTFLARYGQHLPFDVKREIRPEDDPESRLEAAVALHASGDVASAIPLYAAVLEDAPDFVAAEANLASALRQANRSEEALAIYRRLVARGAAGPEVLFNFGNLLAERRRVGESERAYRSALALAPAMAAATFNLGNLLRDEGRLDEAEAFYRRALELRPDWPPVHANLGILLRRTGRAADAVVHHRKAVALEPDNVDHHVNLANALLSAGQPESAAARYRLALRRRPGRESILKAMGDAYAAANRVDEARAAYASALEVAPGAVPAALSLARLLVQREEAESAERVLRRAIAAVPGEPRLLGLLGQVLHGMQRLEEALPLYERALAIDPGSAETHYAFGAALHQMGYLAEARAKLERAVELDPSHVSARVRLGTVLRALDCQGEAIAQLVEAVRLRPADELASVSLALALAGVARHTEAIKIARSVADRVPESADAHMVLGYARAQQGRIEEALEALAKARELRPDHRMVLSNTLFTMLYSDALTPDEIAAAHVQLTSRIECGPEERFAPRRTVDVDRQLRIGYLSPDLRDHPVGYFIEPVLRCHRPERFDITCYSDCAARDETNERLRGYASTWRDTLGWTDERLGRRIVEDGIDILVDLAGHTASNRSTLLARRPAPVQASYLGYPGTSGLSTMDYLIADAHVCPPEQRSLYRETVVALEGCFLCYAPNAGAPPAAPLPAAHAGFVTFGSFSTLCKLSARTVALWSRVLRAVPASRLMLRAQALVDAGTRRDVRERFAAVGIGPDRLELTGPLRPLEAYLAAYADVDLVLDTVPFGGGTTTCDALWMGVPVITLTGDRFCGRMGTSILEAIGLGELAARDEDAFVRIAVAMAGDPDRMAEHRRRLRERVAASCLCDEQGFTLRIENAYRAMWREWCARQATTPGASARV